MILYEKVKNVYDLVNEAADIYGDKCYIRYEENDEIFETSFMQLKKYCDALGAWLFEQEALYGRKVHVGVIGAATMPYISVLLGTMYSGNVVVPLDPQLEYSSLCENLNKADIDVLFFDLKYKEILDDIKLMCPNIKEYYCLNKGYMSDNLELINRNYIDASVQPEIFDDDMAMILFTSGTTGKGKGVMLSHRNLIDNTFCSDIDENAHNSVYLNVLPLHHVFCINGDLFLNIRYGNTICLNIDLALLGKHIKMFNPNVIRMVPMMAKSLLNKYLLLRQSSPEEDPEISFEKVFGTGLNEIVSGGGYLPVELANKFKAIGIDIAQGYGMSECSPKISAPDYTRPDKVSSVGKVVKRCEIKIVDGEIWVKSPSVMLGYYKDEELTKETINEDGYLMTGDLGYVDEEGFLYLTGRKKNLIILSNGENVAPEQLEYMFENDRLVEEIVVYGDGDTICAEIYPDFKFANISGISDIAAEVEKIVAKHNDGLPSYKRILKTKLRDVPFEKTASKKIKRTQSIEQKKLEEDKKKYKLPTTELQQKLYNLVASVLGNTDFGIDDKLYEKGLDSMGSVMIISDIADNLSVNITLSELMENDSVIALEKFINQNDSAIKVDYTKREVYPLSAMQTYFAYVLKGNTTSNLPFLFRLDPGVDIDRLVESVKILFSVHPEVKGKIYANEQGYALYRNDEAEVEIPVVRVTDKEWSDIKENIITPFLFTKDELLYHVGIYITPSGTYFFLDLCHIMGDGMSMNVLFEDLNRIYAGEKLETEKYTYYEYILDEKDRESRGLRDGYIAYYKNLMEGLELKHSILIKPDYEVSNKYTSARIHRDITSVTRKNVVGFCRKNGISENIFFLTAYNYLIALYNNDDDSISSSIHSGRTDSRWNRVVGPVFINYFFRMMLIPHETVTDLLKRNAEQVLNTMKCLISNLRADEMFFQFQGDILGIDKIGNLPARRERVELDAVPFHLQVFYNERGYYYELRYHENRFDKKSVEIFVQCYEKLLEALMSETSVRRLKEHLEDDVMPMHFAINVGKINAAAKKRLIARPDETEVKVYVLNKSLAKQPYGAWGDFYVLGVPTAGFVDKVRNPYSDGVLYKTGMMARIMPDKTLDFENGAGRILVQEGLYGTRYVDLCAIEQVLMEEEGISKAEAYIRYYEKNIMLVFATVYGKTQPDNEKLMSSIKDRLGESHLPAAITFYEV